MKIKIKNASCNRVWLDPYKELLKKYDPIETTITYYSDAHNDYQFPAYLIEIPSLAIIPELAEELQEDIIYRRAVKKGEDGCQEPYLLIYDDYIE